MAILYFNSKVLPKPSMEYVAFIDLMGTRSHMGKSVPETANYVFKLHSAIITAWREKNYKNVSVYPVMDGAYITGKQKEAIERIVPRLFGLLANVFYNEELSHKFLVRCSIAYGEVIHGYDIPYRASKAFQSNIGYKEKLLLGNAMIKAFDGEKKASPFGVYLDSSAIKGQGSGVFLPDWKWFNSINPGFSKFTSYDLGREILSYLKSLKGKQDTTGYPEERRLAHIEMVREYYGIE